MLIKISYSNTFPSTGRTLAETVTFERGFGTITGHNEAGKSFLLEMVRWLLFGVKALRGTAADYKKLRGELDFAVRGDIYRVRRTTTTATLYRNEEEIAVGTSPVNLKIVSILGYGLEVFDMANAANQGSLEALSQLRPERRKRLVDSVIGLGVIEDLAKSAGEEATALNRLVENLKSSVREPVAPTKPETYRNSEVIGAERTALTVMKTELDQITGKLAASTRTEPQRPTTDVALSCEDLKPIMDRQAEQKAELAELRRRLAAAPERSPYADAMLDEFEQEWIGYRAWLDAKKVLDAYPEPEHTDADLDAVQLWIDNYMKHRQRLDIRARIDRQKAHDEHVCPSCDHHWYGGQAEIDKLEAQDVALGVIPEEHQRAPNVTEAWIIRQRGLVADFQKALPQIVAARALSPQGEPELTEVQIIEHRRRNAEAGQRPALLEQIETLERQLEGAPNYSTMWAARHHYEVMLERFQADSLSWLEYVSEVEQLKVRKNFLTPHVEQLPAVDRAYSEAILFETRWDEYQRQLESYRQQLEKITEIEAEAEDWKKARVALTNLRTLVKQHLIPSLNKVASSLLFNMTGGQRQKIEVDDDFNIMVDEQAIDTLSGSGKAVANLALRIGLGQVLTNNVMSVFIGDEIDGSMDKDRAENTSRTLQSLKNSISQILLITHKYPSADYYISLGNKHEQPI